MTPPLYPRQRTKSRRPWWPKIFMRCQRIGRPPISTMGLGRSSVSSRRRVPRPPQRMTIFMCAGPGDDLGALALALLLQLGRDEAREALVVDRLRRGGPLSGGLHLAVGVARGLRDPFEEARVALGEAVDDVLAQRRGAVRALLQLGVEPAERLGRGLGHAAEELADGAHGEPQRAACRGTGPALLDVGHVAHVQTLGRLRCLVRHGSVRTSGPHVDQGRRNPPMSLPRKIVVAKPSTTSGQNPRPIATPSASHALPGKSRGATVPPPSTRSHAETTTPRTKRRVRYSDDSMRERLSP